MVHVGEEQLVSWYDGIALSVLNCTQQLIIPINLFGGYPPCGFSDPPDPPKPLTPTHKYPHPQCGCGYLEGPGPGSPEIPQGYPCQSLEANTIR
jgi:hypothetical protein